MVRFARVIVGLFFLTAMLLPFHLLALGMRWPARKTIPVKWHRGVLALLGIRVHVHGAPHISDTGLLLAANHVSWVDIAVMGSVAPLSFIAKDEVRDWGVFGKLARWQRTVFITRERRADTHRQASAISQRLDEGDTLVLFPEGTTSDGNFIYPFKSSLFGALGLTGTQAKSAHWVQPVALVYTRLHGLPMGRYDRPLVAWPGDIELMPHLLEVVRRGVIDVEVCFGDPVQAGPHSDRKQITADMHRTVKQMASAALRGRLTPSQPAQSGLSGHDDE